MRWFVQVSGGGLNEENVHQPILVVVEPRHAGAHSFEVVLLLGLSRVLPERDARLLTDIRVAHRRSRLARLGLFSVSAKTKNRRQREKARDSKFEHQNCAACGW